MTPDAGEDERTHLSDLNSGRTPWRRVWVVLSEPGILRQDSNQLSPQLPWELQDRYGPPAIHDYTPLLLCWSTDGYSLHVDRCDDTADPAGLVVADYEMQGIVAR